MIEYHFSDDGNARIIRYKGIFDFYGFLDFVIRWIKNKDFDFNEKRVVDKPPFTIYEYEGRKKVNYYTMHLILPTIQVWDLEPVEIVKNGQVHHLMKGRMKITVDGGFIIDYDGDFEKKVGIKRMEHFLFFNILYHELFLNVIDYLDYFLVDFKQDLKEYLEMETATNAY